jgi:BirA family biotin operon repressor/biotin-[acetyl-CoA-carboxylase] ligase
MHYRIVQYDEVGSTLDVAHELAAKGAEAGTIVIANAQTAGRGRMGRSWRSEPGAGVWLTLIERPTDPSALDVLSLRIGLALAPALDAFADSPVQLKWPNDLYLHGRKLGGILIEARWREGHPEWVAIGVGINLRSPESEPLAIGLRDGVTRHDVLPVVAPALRTAAAARGQLSAAELAAFDARDFAVGRRVREPVAGIVRGIDSSGALLVGVGSAESGAVTAVRAGSLVLEEAS